ncbi:MAG: site-specific DNA-methyltransferase [Rhodospirillales bacterium]
MNIVERKPSDLVPYKNNARTHSEDQILQIMASIQEFGFTNPILVDEDNGIIAGHGRIAAAVRLDLNTVPTITLEGLTEAQRRAYVIADNKLAMNAGWDDSLLRLELSDLVNMDFDISLTGFSPDDIQNLLRDEHENEDDVPDVPEDPITKPGDVWIMGGHRLICGDSTVATDVEAVLAGVKPHLMVTDPPYGVEYKDILNDHIADWREAWALFPGDVVYVWHAGLQSKAAIDSLVSCGFQLRAQIIWSKHALVMSRGDYHFQHEPCWYAVREKKVGHWNGDRKQSTIWNIDKPMKSETGHSTQKPVECMRRPMINNSSVGQVIYDPFLGSGTTIIAAETEGRYCYGLELSPAYCDVIVKRWEEFTGNTAELEQREAA